MALLEFAGTGRDRLIGAEDDPVFPFRDDLGSVRFDWTKFPKSQRSLRTTEDSCLTHNALASIAIGPDPFPAFKERLRKTKLLHGSGIESNVSAEVGVG